MAASNEFQHAHREEPDIDRRRASIGELYGSAKRLETISNIESELGRLGSTEDMYKEVYETCNGLFQTWEGMLCDGERNRMHPDKQELLCMFRESYQLAGFLERFSRIANNELYNRVGHALAGVSSHVGLNYRNTYNWIEYASKNLPAERIMQILQNRLTAARSIISAPHE